MNKSQYRYRELQGKTRSLVRVIKKLRRSYQIIHANEVLENEKNRALKQVGLRDLKLRAEQGGQNDFDSEWPWGWSGMSDEDEKTARRIRLRGVLADARRETYSDYCNDVQDFLMIFEGQLQRSLIREASNFGLQVELELGPAYADKAEEWVTRTMCRWVHTSVGDTVEEIEESE